MSCRDDCINRDDEPDSFIMGWQSYFDGGCALTTDSEVDADLYRKGWERAKSHASYVEVCGHPPV